MLQRGRNIESEGKRKRRLESERKGDLKWSLIL